MSGTKKDYIDYRVAKSEEVFEDAKILASNARWNSCVNRLYYSSFYLVSALLFKNDIKAETHNGTKTRFFHDFVKNNLVSKEYGKLYSNLFDWRQESDYGDFVDFDEETILPLIDEVFNFNNAVKQLISTIN